MSRREHFIARANAKFNYRFDYSHFVYVNAKTQSVIVCPEHGAFRQTPDKHLQGKHGCPSCWVSIKPQALTGIKRSDSDKQKLQLPAEEFSARVQKKFGSKFGVDLSAYTGYTGAAIRFTCPIHGDFWKKPQVFFISGHGCTPCGLHSKDSQKLLGYDDFISKAATKHGGVYQYPESNRSVYVDRKSAVEIVCSIHGVFTKKPRNTYLARDASGAE